MNNLIPPTPKDGKIFLLPAQLQGRLDRYIVLKQNFFAACRNNPTRLKRNQVPKDLMQEIQDIYRENPSYRGEIDRYLRVNGV